MNPLPRLSSLRCCRAYTNTAQVNRNASIIRPFHASAARAAVAHPVTAHGPPPKSPVPAASQYGEHIERKKRQSDLVKQGKELRKQESPSSVLKKRFWKDVHVKEVPGTRPFCNIWCCFFLLYGIKLINPSCFPRRPSNPSRYPTYPFSLERGSHDPILQATPRQRRCPRMGPSSICTARPEAALDPLNIYSISCRGYRQAG
jgi:hypothetical protein